MCCSSYWLGLRWKLTGDSKNGADIFTNENMFILCLYFWKKNDISLGWHWRLGWTGHVSILGVNWSVVIPLMNSLFSDFFKGFGDLRTLELLLMCIGHHHYEVCCRVWIFILKHSFSLSSVVLYLVLIVIFWCSFVLCVFLQVADITFNFWNRLSEVLYDENNAEVISVFRPYIQRLIIALCRLCQYESTMVINHLFLVIMFLDKYFQIYLEIAEEYGVASTEAVEMNCG